VKLIKLNSPGVAMKKDNKHIERFISLGYKPKKGRGVEKAMLIDGHKACAIAVVLLIIQATFMLYHVRIDFALFAIAMVVASIPITVKVSIYADKKRIENLRHNLDRYSYDHLFWVGGASFGHFFGWVVVRTVFPWFEERTILMIVLVLLTTVIVMFVSVATTLYYKVHLIRAYCPHLRDKTK
jgi:hypothetical protein